MRLPTFLIVGAAKCGTTALTRFLQTHPQVHIPFKEPNFFSGWGTRVKFHLPRAPRESRGRPYCGTIEQYEALFSDAGATTALGDASVSYLADAAAAARIRETLPDVKLIALVRQPVDRAFSHFVMNRRLGLEPESDFCRAMLSEDARLARGWHPFLCYGTLSRYVPQLARYRAVFPRDQLRIYRYEDWARTPQQVWSDLTAFIGVDGSVVPDFATRHNVSRLPRPRLAAIHALKPWIRPLVPRAVRSRLARETVGILWYRPTLDPGDRAELTHALFRDDVLGLQDVLGWDLSSWLP